MIVPDINDWGFGLHACQMCKRLRGQLVYQFATVKIDCDCHITDTCSKCGNKAKQFVLHRVYVWYRGLLCKTLIPLRLPHFCKPQHSETMVAASPIPETPKQVVGHYVCAACEAGHHEHCYGPLESRNFKYECDCGFRRKMGQWSTIAWQMRLKDRRLTLARCQPASSWVQ